MKPFMKCDFRRGISRVVTAAAMIACASIELIAQSTNPASPTPLGSAQTGKGPSKETDYYFSATRGPGEVSVTLKLSAKQYSTFGRVEVADAAGNMLATLNMDAASSTGTAQQNRTFSLPSKQTVRLKLTLDGNLASYTISLSGEAGVSGASSAPARPGATGGGSRPAAGSDPRPRPAANPRGGVGTGGSGDIRRNSISIECPTTLVAAIQFPSGWSAPFGSELKRPFLEAAITGSQISCRYGETMDATLIRPVPKGYSCEIYNSGGSKPRFIECKLGGPAGKISN